VLDRDLSRVVPGLGSFCQNEEVDAGVLTTFSSTNSTSRVFFRAAALDKGAAVVLASPYVRFQNWVRSAEMKILRSSQPDRFPHQFSSVTKIGLFPKSHATEAEPQSGLGWTANRGTKR